MRTDTFIRRLLEGKCNNLTYQAGDLEGLVTVWKHEGSFVLTWEECPVGEQYDESTYTRDERVLFTSLDDLYLFLSANDLEVELFVP